MRGDSYDFSGDGMVSLRTVLIGAALTARQTRACTFKVDSNAIKESRVLEDHHGNGAEGMQLRRFELAPVGPRWQWALYAQVVEIRDRRAKLLKPVGCNPSIARLDMGQVVVFRGERE
jgi:hypothetical protein